ncbi:hypothetical protein BH11BAC2_BH11BAC2_23480 [soil metagenome]
MKKYLFPIAIITTLFFASCTDQTATPGSDDRDKFTGDWLCTETIAGTPTTFTININKEGLSDTINIRNFSGYGSSANALGFVNGNSLTIPGQEIGVTNIPVQGSGIYSDPLSGEKISMNYSTDGQSASATCVRN